MKNSLSFDDVLLVPQFSDIETRSDIDTSVRLMNGVKLTIPIVSSPMDTVTGVSMADELSRLGGLGIIHRYNSVGEQVDMVVKICKSTSIFGAAIGVTGDYLERLNVLYSSGCRIFCIDVAHGHHENVRKAIQSINDLHFREDIHLMTGNIATADGYEFLAMNNVDSVRVGVGGGCFLPNTQVNTDKGLNLIQDIEIGDKVFTHDGTLKEVIGKISYFKDEEIVSINHIDCTKNHEFYVVNKKDVKYINDNNIDKYAFWIEAYLLDKEIHLLIELEHE